MAEKQEEYYMPNNFIILITVYWLGYPPICAFEVTGV
jgi:hypothetical protein